MTKIDADAVTTTESKVTLLHIPADDSKVYIIAFIYAIENYLVSLVAGLKILRPFCLFAIFKIQ